MTFTTLSQALRAARKFHCRFGSKGYTYRTTRGFNSTGKFCIAVHSANGVFLTLV